MEGHPSSPFRPEVEPPHGVPAYRARGVTVDSHTRHEFNSLGRRPRSAGRTLPEREGSPVLRGLLIQQDLKRSCAFNLFQIEKRSRGPDWMAARVARSPTGPRGLLMI